MIEVSMPRKRQEEEGARREKKKRQTDKWPWANCDRQDHRRDRVGPVQSGDEPVQVPLAVQWRVVRPEVL